LPAIETEQRNTQAKSLKPPFRVISDFLAEDTVLGLLAYAEANEPRFVATKVGDGIVRPVMRASHALRDLGVFKADIKAKINALVPALIAELRVTPFEPSGIELELVAHGDGAFYKRHIDTRTAAKGPHRSIRVLSGVYYFHSLPKAFEGGALRLYEIATSADDAGFVDIEPVRNTLLFFPSWAPHEVMPISCPSGRFMDSRFAINCWVHRKSAEAAP
jgi:Rps23 Pro-64 3,4-dihydroxylase Tpa1-like proline 4-hydroxylase